MILYGNYHTKPTFHNLRSMMYSWGILGDSGVENDTFFDRKRTHFDINFQASFLMSCWLKIGAKKVPKMDPKSQFLKIILTTLVHKISTLGLRSHFGVSWATSGPQNVHLCRLGVVLVGFGIDFESILVQFWVIWGRVCWHLGCFRTTVHELVDTPLRATGHH